MDVQDWSTLILAVVGLLGWGTSTWLNRRGADRQHRQAEAAGKLAERTQAFTELEAANERLAAEVTRKDADVDRARAETTRLHDLYERRLATRDERCRATTSSLTAALEALRGVVLSELVRSEARHAIDEANEHLTTDHPPPRPQEDHP